MTLTILQPVCGNAPVIWQVLLDNYFTHAVLSVHLQLLRKHEYYKNTVDTPRDTTIGWGRFSQPVFVPSLYSSEAPRVV